MDEERLRQLRSQEVLDDLEKKFGKNVSSEPESKSSDDPLRTHAVLQELEARQALEIARIDNSPFRQELLRGGDLQKIFEARGRAGAHFIREIEAGKDWQDVLKKVEGFLDSLNIWEAKFTTMPGSGNDTELESGPTDSIYYMTPSGQSLRLRKSSMTDGSGPKHVIEPVYEKIYFTAPGSGGKIANEKPQIGYWVKEISSKAFDSEQVKYNNTRQAPGDFKSPLKIHSEGNQLVAVVPDIGHDIDEHQGDRINNIIFNRQL